MKKSTNICTISNNIEVYENPVARTKKILHYAAKFEAGEEKRIVHESLYVNSGELSSDEFSPLIITG